MQIFKVEIDSNRLIPLVTSCLGDFIIPPFVPAAQTNSVYIYVARHYSAVIHSGNLGNVSPARADAIVSAAETHINGNSIRITNIIHFAGNA